MAVIGDHPQKLWGVSYEFFSLFFTFPSWHFTPEGVSFG